MTILNLISIAKGNDRMAVWNSKRKPLFSIYSDVWKGSDGNESWAYIYVYKFKKVNKNKAKNGSSESFFLVIYQELIRKHRYTEKNGTGLHPNAILSIV